MILLLVAYRKCGNLGDMRAAAVSAPRPKAAQGRRASEKEFIMVDSRISLISRRLCEATRVALGSLSGRERQLSERVAEFSQVVAGFSQQVAAVSAREAALSNANELLRSELAVMRSELGACRAALAEHAENLWRQRRILLNRETVARPPGSGSLAPVEGHKELGDCFKELERIVPRAFAVWKELLDVNAAAYEGFPIDSCSVEGHPMAEEFHWFLKPFLRGAVLDVGCGPQPLPSYLRDYPADRIAGVDPLLPVQPHPFTFVQGLAEFLPWEDKTFSVVVLATSLDHVLLLDRALKEFRRVLEDDGRLIVWVAHIPGADRYDPYRADIERVDKFHLFHFDKPWFEEMLGEHFRIDEVVTFPERMPGQFLYSYRPACKG